MHRPPAALSLPALRGPEIVITTGDLSLVLAAVEVWTDEVVVRLVAQPPAGTTEHPWLGNPEASRALDLEVSTASGHFTEAYRSVGFAGRRYRIESSLLPPDNARLSSEITLTIRFQDQRWTGMLPAPDGPGDSDKTPG